MLGLECRQGLEAQDGSLTQNEHSYHALSSSGQAAAMLYIIGHDTSALNRWGHQGAVCVRDWRCSGQRLAMAAGPEAELRF